MGSKLSGKRLDEAKRKKARLLLSEGVQILEVASAIGCGQRMICNLIRQYGRRRPRLHNPLRLSLREREEISRGLSVAESFRSIARKLGRPGSTVSREVKANGGRAHYRAWCGEERAERCGLRPRRPKLWVDSELSRSVERGLAQKWSPQQIAKRLRHAHPDNPAMHVSHETIYKALFIQGRGALRKELTRHLRSRRTERRPRGRAELRGSIPDLVEISQRPAEAADRAVPGHWEGDLILGKGNNSAIGTLVERKTRFVLLLHLPNGRTAEHVRVALTNKIQELPEQLRRSLTWDRGKEMAQHAQFTVDTGVRVFFCDPHSPWQRGSNENTNGLLRQYFPKGQDLGQYDAKDLDFVADELNRRPRQTLEWKTPCEVLNELMR